MLIITPDADLPQPVQAGLYRRRLRTMPLQDESDILLSRCALPWLTWHAHHIKVLMLPCLWECGGRHALQVGTVPSTMGDCKMSHKPQMVHPLWEELLLL